MLAAGGSDGAISYGTPRDRAWLPNWPGDTGEVLWGAWGLIGDRAVLATGGEDGTVRLWDPEQRRRLGS